MVREKRDSQSRGWKVWLAHGTSSLLALAGKKEKEMKKNKPLIHKM